MTRPGYRAMTSKPREAVTVDYADVLRQAVENERWRIYRQVIATVSQIPIEDRDTNHSWSRSPRSAKAFRDSLLKTLNAQADDE